MDKIILEFIKDSGRRSEYRIFSSIVVRIGRGYENDLIVSDPHVSQTHCVIRVHEDGFSIQDSGSLNGTWLERHIPEQGGFLSSPRNGSHKIKVEGMMRIYSGDIIHVGGTNIRFLVSGQPVEPAIPMLRPSPFFEEISSPGKAWLIVISAVMLTCAIEHQESFKNLPVSKFFSVGIGLLLTFLVWSGIWSFIGWLVKRKAFFNAHLSWAALFFLAMTLFYPLSDHLGYLASSHIVEMTVGSIILWVFISALIAGHLMLATLIPRRYQIGVAVGLSLIMVLFGVVTYFAGRPQFNAQPELYGTLVPPYVNGVLKSESVSEFLKNSNKIFIQKPNE